MIKKLGYWVHRQILFTSSAALQQQRFARTKRNFIVSAKSKQKKRFRPTKRTETLGISEDFVVLLSYYKVNCQFLPHHPYDHSFLCFLWDQDHLQARFPQGDLGVQLTPCPHDHPYDPFSQHILCPQASLLSPVFLGYLMVLGSQRHPGLKKQYNNFHQVLQVRSELGNRQYCCR